MGRKIPQSPRDAIAEAAVYIIAQQGPDGPTSPCKIGLADNPRSRIKELQTASPFRLSLHRVFWFPKREFAREVEGLLHHMEARNRLVGEWFNLEPDKAAGLVELYVRMTVDYMLATFSETERRQALSMICGKVMT